MSGTCRGPLVLVGLALAGGSAATTISAASPRLVPCGQVIDSTASPRQGGYRVVLGAVSVPPTYLPQVVPTHTNPWRFWRKAALIVRASRGPVAISVPEAWRTRVAVVWGNSGGPYARLRIAKCSPRSRSRQWNVYAGGFYLRSRSTCAPLIVRVGGRAGTVRFGLGRSCA